ncbi:MAG: adenylate/guanylate cyclase domain-containing protein [Fimbriimonadaceae bacterium]|nr:adenylate/guanylate cyclase domain-containing protein [Fimbriimonadaceae bacterium]
MPTAGAVFALITSRVRIQNFLLTVLFNGLVLSLSFGGAFAIAVYLTIFASLAGDGKQGEAWHVFDAINGSPAFLSSMFAALGLATLYSAVSQVSRKLGPGILWNWITGKYHQPREETRFFMFLDMKDSTTLAERLGNLKFSALVRDCFSDITDPCVATGAEVSHYIGDEVVISWKIKRGRTNANCIRFFFSIQSLLLKRRLFYERKYGILPQFKAGLHFGKVVTTEVGDLKSEIVFHGDVMNTTARIQGLCGPLGHDLLVSSEAVEQIGANSEFVFESLGHQHLKGREATVEVCSVSER